jgi:hypothetical protein
MKKTILQGDWIYDGKRVIGDDACDQSDSLLPTLAFLASL